jgi:hypothetical protein
MYYVLVNYTGTQPSTAISASNGRKETVLIRRFLFKALINTGGRAPQPTSNDSKGDDDKKNPSPYPVKKHFALLLK